MISKDSRFLFELLFSRFSVVYEGNKGSMQQNAGTELPANTRRRESTQTPFWKRLNDHGGIRFVVPCYTTAPNIVTKGDVKMHPIRHGTQGTNIPTADGGTTGSSIA